MSLCILFVAVPYTIPTDGHRKGHRVVWGLRARGREFAATIVESCGVDSSDVDSHMVSGHVVGMMLCNDFVDVQHVGSHYCACVVSGGRGLNQGFTNTNAMPQHKPIDMICFQHFRCNIDVWC